VKQRNPVVRIREELKLSRKQMCHGAGLRLDSLYLAEGGLLERPQVKLLVFLQTLGYTRDAVVSEYRAYRQSLRAEVLALLGDVRSDQQDSNGAARAG
jgi:hypothetical protein